MVCLREKRLRPGYGSHRREEREGKREKERATGLERDRDRMGERVPDLDDLGRQHHLVHHTVRYFHNSMVKCQQLPQQVLHSS